MNFKQFLREKRFGDALKAERKIIDFLNTSEASKFKKDDLVFIIPVEVLDKLGISGNDIRELEISSTGNEKFLATLDNDMLSLYLKKEPRYLRL